MESYASWLETRIANRRERAGAARPTVRFSVLTTVYERTPADLFSLTADSLTTQTLPFFEWIVLAHGPISDELDAVLVGLDARPDVTVARRPQNLGIVGGMHVCLELAQGDYIVPMDADDLLTIDALQQLAVAAEANGRPGFIYSDENILVDGIPIAPYWRPDWDPVLNLSSSYVWHLCCIRRDAAVDAGLYTDSAADFCHDWDTVFRIVQAGHQPVHVREPLYHWRQHPVSTTNRPDPDSGSRRSTRALLQAACERTGRPELYAVEDFPIFRGAPEWTVTRLPQQPPPVALVTFGGVRNPRTLELPFASRHAVAGGSAPPPPPWWKFWRSAPQRGSVPGIADLKRLLAEVREPYVMLLSDAVSPVGDDWFWESVKLLELHPDVRLAHGLLVDGADTVRGGGAVYLADGSLVCPQAGKPATDPGPFAIALKPHCTGAATTDLMLADTAFLLAALADEDDDASLAGLGTRLAEAGRARGMLTAFSPLIKATITGSLLDSAPRAAAPGRARVATPGPAVRGPAGFLDHAGLYR